MTLHEFNAELGKRLVDPDSLPFVCEGSPLKCSVFLVGTIGARRPAKPFIRFWDPSYGFRKEYFLQDLQQSYGKLTRTRQRIEAIAKIVGDQDTLDTNLYLRPPPGSKNLTAKDKVPDVFEWLLYTIKPQVVFAYGRQAKDFFRGQGLVFSENSLTPQEADLNGLRFKFLSWTHLVYQTSNAQIIEIGRALAEAKRSSLRMR